MSSHPEDALLDQQPGSTGIHLEGPVSTVADLWKGPGRASTVAVWPPQASKDPSGSIYMHECWLALFGQPPEASVAQSWLALFRVAPEAPCCKSRLALFGQPEEALAAQ